MMHWYGVWPQGPAPTAESPFDVLDRRLAAREIAVTTYREARADCPALPHPDAVAEACEPPATPSHLRAAGVRHHRACGASANGL